MQPRRGWLWLAFCLGLTVLAVGGAPRLLADFSVVERPTVALQEQTLPFQILAGDTQGINALVGETPRLFLITTPDELNRLRDLVAPSDFIQIEKVDFQRAVLIAFFAGAALPSLRPTTTIEHISLREADLVVYVHSTPVTDTASASVQSVATSPYQVVQIARTAATYAPRHLVLHTEAALSGATTAIPLNSPLQPVSPLPATASP